jgi:hypothetical protein
LLHRCESRTNGMTALLNGVGQKFQGVSFSSQLYSLLGSGYSRYCTVPGRAEYVGRFKTCYCMRVQNVQGFGTWKRAVSAVDTERDTFR